MSYLSSLSWLLLATERVPQFNNSFSDQQQHSLMEL